MFKRLSDSKLNVIYGTVGSGKTMAISLLLSELLIQKCDKNIVFISENRNESYKLRLYKTYEYLHRYKSLFRKNIKERLDFISGEKTERRIEYLENIEFINIFNINKGISVKEFLEKNKVNCKNCGYSFNPPKEIYLEGELE